jgi:hypothetical protein
VFTGYKPGQQENTALLQIQVGASDIFSTNIFSASVRWYIFVK